MVSLPKPVFQIGDRVERPIFLDDGTWDTFGDTCLDDSPQRLGTVVGLGLESGEILGVRFPDASRQIVYEVEWDDGKRGRGYFADGLFFETGLCPNGCKGRCVCASAPCGRYVGWIAAEVSERGKLELLGCVLGAYDDGAFDCVIDEPTMKLLDKYFGSRYVWSLSWKGVG